MELPRSVVDQVERAEKLQKALMQEKPQGSQNVAADTKDVQTEQGAGNERDTSQAQNTGQPGGNDDHTRETGGTQKTEEQSQSTEQDHNAQKAQGVEDGDWKQRYFSLQGKYKAEVPLLQNQNRELQKALGELQEQVRKLSQEQSDKAFDADLEKFTEYGDEFAELAKTLKQMQEENSSLKQIVAQLQGDFSSGFQQQTQTDYDLYLGQVKTKLVEMGTNYETINYDPGFLAYLQEKPQGAEHTRHELLLDAEQRLDLYTTISIFKDYLQTTKTNSQSHDQSREDKPKPNIQPPPVNTGADNETQGGTKGKIWTREEISQFYRDKTAGVYRGEKGREKAAAIEADIFAAQTQGRIAS